MSVANTTHAYLSVWVVLSLTSATLCVIVRMSLYGDLYSSFCLIHKLKGAVGTTQTYKEVNMCELRMDQCNAQREAL